MNVTDQTRHSLARGLAKAAMHLAASGKLSALDVAREAVSMHRDGLSLAAYCKVALQMNDLSSLQKAMVEAEAGVEEFPELRSIVTDLRSGSAGAIELTNKLYERRPIAFEPVVGRILYLLHKSLPYVSNGYTIRSHGVAKAMAVKGCDIVCATRPGFSGTTPSRQVGLVDPHEVVEGVRYARLDAPAPGNFIRHPGDVTADVPLQYLKFAWRRIAAFIQEVRPACVVAGSNFATALPACLAARESGVPFVYEVRGFWEITRASWDPGYEQSPTGRQELFYETSVACAADAVVTLTNPMREELIARGVAPKRITVAPNACDPETFRPLGRDVDLMRDLGLYSDVPIIGYAGSFNAYEGLDDVVRACGALKQQGLVFRLMLIGVELPDHKGAFPVTEGINQLAAEAGLDEWLIMPGLVPHDDVRRWYSLIDIAPFARKSQPVTELVSPIKPLEAMAMGKAVVVSSVRGMEDMVSHGETGQVFPSGDVVALESELHRLLENVSLRQSLGRAARRWVVDKRSWSQSADAMLAAVEPLMGGRS
jgi:glycosyltransferase involved in cell wall biosynthesis